jgi:hypothetical protein
VQIGVKWDPENYPVSSNDYVYAMLLETPELYFVAPSRMVVFVFVVNVGMIRVWHDFRNMTEIEVEQFVLYVRQSL